MLQKRQLGVVSSSSCKKFGMGDILAIKYCNEAGFHDVRLCGLSRQALML